MLKKQWSVIWFKFAFNKLILSILSLLRPLQLRLFGPFLFARSKAGLSGRGLCDDIHQERTNTEGTGQRGLAFHFQSQRFGEWSVNQPGNSGPPPGCRNLSEWFSMSSRPKRAARGHERVGTLEPGSRYSLNFSFCPVLAVGSLYPSA